MKSLIRSRTLLLIAFAVLTSSKTLTAAPRSPMPPMPEFSRVSYSERFDSDYYSQARVAEIDSAGLGKLVESWSGYALQRAGDVLPFVISGVTGSRTNLYPNGAARLWVKPYWSSASTGDGKGMGAEVVLLEMSVVGQSEAASVWSLRVSADGSVIYLWSGSEKETGVLLKSEIAWRAGEWHQLVLNYSEKGSSLAVDGEIVAEGGGTVLLPSHVTALTVGSNLRGTESLGGEIEDVYCFARPLKLGFHYTPFKDMAARGAISAEEMAYREELAEKHKAAKALKAKEEEESGGGMMLRMAGPSVDCVTNGPVYLTNVVCNFNTNDGWTMYFDIAGGTNEVVYDIFSTPEIVGSDITNSIWTWLETGMTCETHYFTNQPTNQTFYILTVPGADRDGDGLYDGWEWKHFGTLAQSASGDYDGDGETNGVAYSNNNDPNQIKFAIGFGTSHVNGNSATGSVTVLQGVPDQIAVLVNSTNFDGAVWQPYQSSVVASIGNTDGEYVVWVGVRGHAPDTQRIWRGTTITRDTIAPILVITNPVASTLSQPALQLQGYGNEPLLSVRYDITNATESLTNLDGYITRQTLDTNTLRYTTNWFQCYDVALATNLNTITVRIADLAGNVTTTSLNLTLDYSGDTNAPSIAVTWPDDNALVAGTNFTLRGQLDDGTASVSVSVGSNSITGTVDRDGYFEVQAVPMEAVTNEMSVIATDVSGNSTVATRTVRQSSETLTINAVTPSQLTQPTVTVSGSVGTSGQSVWVNGIAATVTGNAWTANVPTPASGVANFDMQTGSSFGNPTAAQGVSVESPPQVRPVSYTEKYVSTWEQVGISWNGTTTSSLTRTQSWTLGNGGGSHQNSSVTLWPSCEASIVWSNTWPDQQTFFGASDCLSPNPYVETTVLPWQKSGLRYSLYYFESDPVDAWTIRQTAERNAETRLELLVGGEAKPGQQKLIRLTASAATFSNPERNFIWAGANASFENDTFESIGDVPIPVSDIRILGQTLTPTATNANVGEIFLNFPAGSTNDLPFSVVGATEYSFDVKAEEVTVELAVDANRDGAISFDTADKTKPSNPYRFWVNNDQDDQTDDESVPVSAPDYADSQINSMRDLEDFTRLNLLVESYQQAIIDGQLRLGLKWKNIAGSIAIKVWRNLSTNGSAGYLENETVAQSQLQLTQPGHVYGQNTYLIPSLFWQQIGLSSSNPVAHLLIEGAGTGKGELVVTLHSADGAEIGETSGIVFDLMDVKSMYERATATSDPSEMAFPHDYTGPDDNNIPNPTMSWSPDANGFGFQPDPYEQKTYIVFVHGWNQTYDRSIMYGETMFKRMWQRGYKGRFSVFRWPTFVGLLTYDNSEYRAWKCGESLKQYLASLPTDYTINAAAHSMGNFVCGSALRQGASVANYAMMNSAVPAMCHDTDTNLFEWAYTTPNTDPDTDTRALAYIGQLTNFNCNAINFFLSSDFATTTTWEANNYLLKPHRFNALTTGYGYDPMDVPGHRLYITFLTSFGRYLIDSHESTSYACQSLSKTVGGQGDTAGSIDTSVDMDTFGFDTEHSAQFIWSIQRTLPFYSELLVRLNALSP